MVAKLEPHLELHHETKTKQKIPTLNGSNNKQQQNHRFRKTAAQSYWKNGFWPGIPLLFMILNEIS